MLNFMMRFGSVAAELNRLLGMRFSKGVGSKTEIGQSLSAILYYQNQGDYLQRDCELGKATLLVKELQEIERYDPNLLKAFKRQIHKSVTRGQYFGARLEINIAATLIRKDTKFTKGESPDFTINKENKDIFIECGSAHLSRRKLGDLKCKISSVVNEKSNKTYCNPSTALCIDITNIYYSSLINEALLEKDEIRQYVRKTLEAISFGSVIVFIYAFNRELDRFESGYIRIDNRNIDETLLNFLNECFPISEHTLHEFSIPSEG